MASNQQSENIFLKGHIANILGFIDHTVSVAIIHSAFVDQKKLNNK